MSETVYGVITAFFGAAVVVLGISMTQGTAPAVSLIAFAVGVAVIVYGLRRIRRARIEQS